MLVKIREHYGYVTVHPVNERTAAAIIRDAKKNGAPDDFDASVFLQGITPAELAELFGPRATWRGEINDGAVIRCDNWTFRQYCGYSSN